MGKKRFTGPPEEALILPARPNAKPDAKLVPIVDTHTHLASTYSAYVSKYPNGKFSTSIYDFVRGMYENQHVEAIIDVWCEPSTWNSAGWKEIADSAIEKEKWGGLEYWFVMGCHPHEAKHYTDEIEAEIVSAMSHPRCVGWGEMGLDYHYDNSPREIQREVFVRQLKQAVRLGKPLTIHTREADEDTERILKEFVPKEYKIHIHCFTDSPAFGQRLLDHFPNLCIGITGVITFTSNTDTPTLVRQMVSSLSPASTPPQNPAAASKLRILLETDAPFMIPANIYASLSAPTPLPSNAPTPVESKTTTPVLSASSSSTNLAATQGDEQLTKEQLKEKWRLQTKARKESRAQPETPTQTQTQTQKWKTGQRLPFSHSGMIPWTTEFVAGLLNDIIIHGEGEGQSEGEGAGAGEKWDSEMILRIGRENARRVYGV